MLQCREYAAVGTIFFVGQYFSFFTPHKAVQKVCMMLWISKVIRSAPISLIILLRVKGGTNGTHDYLDSDQCSLSMNKTLYQKLINFRSMCTVAKVS